MIFSYVKIAVLVAVVVAIAGAYGYVKSLQTDLATSEKNNTTLTTAVETQKAVIKQQLVDMETIKKINKEQVELNKKLELAVDDLKKKFHKVNASGKKRDLGALAASRSGAIERVLNAGTLNAMRCVEVAMGAPLTEKEKNAKKKSEINPECPDIHPNYVLYGER